MVLLRVGARDVATHHDGPGAGVEEGHSRVTDGGDAVFIKPADSAVDKMVDALLKDATAEVA